MRSHIQTFLFRKAKVQTIFENIQNLLRQITQQKFFTLCVADVVKQLSLKEGVNITI